MLPRSRLLDGKRIHFALTNYHYDLRGLYFNKHVLIGDDSLQSSISIKEGRQLAHLENYKLLIGNNIGKIIIK
jgi:hypothetical protein